MLTPSTALLISSIFITYYFIFFPHFIVTSKIIWLYNFKTTPFFLNIDVKIQYEKPICKW